MSSLKPSARLGRLLRQDVWENLGRPTQEQVCDAIDEGRLEEAKLLARYMVPENKALHDFFCDLIWNILSEVANRHGEEEMADILKKSQETWMMKRTWKGFLTLPVEERVQITAEIMRSHRCGPKQDGTIQVTEDEDPELELEQEGGWVLLYPLCIQRNPSNGVGRPPPLGYRLP
jgi:hypothetical protein